MRLEDLKFSPVVPYSLSKALARVERCIIINLEKFATSYDDKLINKLKSQLIGTLTTVYAANLGLQFSEQIVEGVLHYLTKHVIQGVYVFRINPRSVSLDDKKLLNVIRYGFGSFEIQYFGTDMISMTLEGQTGALIPPAPFLKMGMIDIRASVAYLKLVELETFFREGHSLFLFGLLERFYYGYLIDFGYTFKSETPYNIGYKLVMGLHPHRYWYGDVIHGGLGGFNLDVLETVQKLSDSPINFYAWR